DALPDLRGVAAELLAERDGHSIHEVRPARLDDVVELHRLRLQRDREPVESREQIVDDLAQRRQMDGRGEDVVRGLAHVDVVVRALAGRSPRARLALLLFAFLCGGLPDRAGKTSTGNCSPPPPAATRSAAAAIRCALSASSRPRSAWTRAAADLMRPSQRATG